MVTRATSYLPAHQRVLVHTSGWLLLASGVAWLGVHDLVGAGTGALPHPLEPWLMRTHALAAWLAAFALGGIAAQHIPRGWQATQGTRASAQRRLGLALCVLALALLLSGYALMYWIPEPVHAAWGWAHSVAGAAMAALALVHGSGALQRRPA